MERHFRGFTIEHLPRKSNGEVDELTKKAAKGEAMPPDIFFGILTVPSTRLEKQSLSTINAIASMDWRAPTLLFFVGIMSQSKPTTWKGCTLELGVMFSGRIAFSSSEYVHRCSSASLKSKA
jgi:hypothetical protein